MRTIILIVLSFALALSGRLSNADIQEHQSSWQEKIDQELLFASGAEPQEFIVFLSEQADLSGAADLKTKAEKGEYVYQQLIAAARRSQAPIVQYLSLEGVEYRPYWVANMIWVRGNGETLQNAGHAGGCCLYLC